MDQGCRPPHGAKSKLLLFMQVSTRRWLLVESSVADLPGSILENTHWSLLGSAEVFIDPFLLFNSKKPEYQALHAEIIRYVKFLRDKTLACEVNRGGPHSALGPGLPEPRSDQVPATERG